MVSVRAKNRRRRVLRYAFGGALVLMAGLNVLIGSAWYLSLGVAVTAGFIINGQRRIFHVGVTRMDDEVVCRYIPWYEGNAYSALVLIPLMGVAMGAAGRVPGYPAWLLLGGVFLFIVVTPLVVYGIVRMWRRSILRITPSTLTVRLAERGSELTEIRREQIESIEPRIVPLPYAKSLQIAITYRPAGDGSDTTSTVIIGLRLTVRPVNLLHALVAWRDGANENPSELLDRVEQLLRGRSTAGV
jgi:hypothetical protein